MDPGAAREADDTGFWTFGGDAFPVFIVMSEVAYLNWKELKAEVKLGRLSR